MDFYKDLIAMDKRLIKSRKEFIKTNQDNLKKINSKKGDSWFSEYFRESIIKDYDSIKEARERIKKNKERIAALKARQDKTESVDSDLVINLKELLGNLKDIEAILFQGKPKKPALRLIKGGLLQ